MDESSERTGHSHAVTDTHKGFRSKDSNWLNDNVMTPAYNAFADDIWNPAANVSNAVAQAVCRHDIAGKLEAKPLAEVSPVSLENAARLATGGVVGAITYSLCARTAGLGLGGAATSMELEGVSARLLASERSAMVVGAAVHDACKDAPDARTRATNALAGAASFYCFDVGNTFASQLKNKLAYYPTLALTGAGASVVSNAVSGRHDSDPGRSAVESAALNVFFPGTHELFAKAADHLNVNGLKVGGLTLLEGGRGVSLERYRRNSHMDGVSPTLDQLGNRHFLARVQPSASGNYINARNGLIHLERPGAQELGHELAHIGAAREYERDMQHAASLLSTDGAAAKTAYMDARINQERFARDREIQIASELNHTSADETAGRIGHAHGEPLAEYQPIFEKEFETFAASNGKWRPDRDYMLLSTEEQERLRHADRPYEFLSALYPEMTDLEKSALTKRLDAWKQEGNEERNSYDLIYGMRRTSWRHALKMCLIEDYVRGLRSGVIDEDSSIIANHGSLGEFRQRASQAMSRFLDAYDNANETQSGLERNVHQKNDWLDQEEANRDALIWVAEAKLEKQREAIDKDYERDIEPWKSIMDARTAEANSEYKQGCALLLKQHGVDVDKLAYEDLTDWPDTDYLEQLGLFNQRQDGILLALDQKLANGLEETEYDARVSALDEQGYNFVTAGNRLAEERERKGDELWAEFKDNTAPMRSIRDRRFAEAKEEFKERERFLRHEYSQKTAQAIIGISELKNQLNKIQQQKHDEILHFRKSLMRLCNQLSDDGVIQDLPTNREISQPQAARALSIALMFQGDTPSWWSSGTHWLNPVSGKSIDLPLLPKEDAESLRNFVKKNLKHSPQKLEEIAQAWPSFTRQQQDALQNLHVSDARDFLRVLENYPNTRSLALAHESAKHRVPPELYDEIETRFLDSAKIKEAFPTDRTWSNGTMNGYFLKRTDPRALYLGWYTNSCMHVDGAWASGTWWNQESPDGGFFVVQDAATGDIEAASRVWRVPNEANTGVCFNNVEAKGLGKRANQVLDIYKQAAQDLLGKDNTTVVTVGDDVTDLNADSLPKYANPLPLPATYPSDAWLGCRVQRVLASSEPLPVRSNTVRPGQAERTVDAPSLDAPSSVSPILDPLHARQRLLSIINNLQNITAPTNNIRSGEWYSNFIGPRRFFDGR
jgi:hypothetical protein